MTCNGIPETPMSQAIQKNMTIEYQHIMFKTVECAQIDFDDTTFLMSYPLQSPAVLSSVGTVGVIHPIVLSGCCACCGAYRIVMGFRRAYACRGLDIPVVNAYISQVDPDDPGTMFFLALHENLAHRTFNDVEKSVILSKLLHQFACPQDDVIRKYMPLLKLNPSEKVLESYLQIARFEEAMKEFLAAHTLPMTVIDLLSSLSVDDRGAVFELISRLKFGVNKIRDVLTHLEEIALRDHCSIQDILHEAEIQHILHHPKYPTPQKAERIRRLLREKRFPGLSTIEHDYQASLKALAAPTGVQLKTDRFFEDDTLTAAFRFQTPEQLKIIAEDLVRLSETPELQDVLDVIHGTLRP